MGGRGGTWARVAARERRNQGEASAATTSKVATTNQQKAAGKTAVALKSTSDIPAFIREQTGVDIGKYRDSTTARFDKTRGRNQYITVDWKSMPQTDRQKLSSLANKSYNTNISLEDMGSWAKAIRIKNNKH